MKKHNFKKSLKSVINNLINALPVSFRVKLKNLTDEICYLDYRGKHIRLIITSMIELKRSRSCDKEPDTINWIENYMKKDQVFYDIGANIGVYSLVAATHLNGQIKIYAFEPVSSSFTQLCRNIKLNSLQRSITPLNIALSSRDHVYEFKINDFTAGSASHMGLLNPEEHLINNEFSYPVHALTLDTAVRLFQLQFPDHIKIDVDGYEYFVLQGSLNTLKYKRLKTIQIEIEENSNEMQNIVKLLEKYMFKIKKKHVHENPLVNDYLFVRE